MKKQSPMSITGYAILACFLWSTAFVGVKIGLRYSKPLSFAGIRFIISGIMILPFCGNFLSYLSVVRKNIKTVVLTSIFQTFLLYYFFYTGMTIVQGATGAIVIGSSPLFFAIAAHIAFKNDKLTVKKMISIFLGILGIIIISISRNTNAQPDELRYTGIALLVFGCFASAIGNIIVTKERNNMDPLILNSAQIALGGFLLLLLSIPLEGAPVLIQPLPFWLTLGWLSTLSAIAFSIWFVLLKIPGLKISELNLWKFIIPVCGALLSWLLLPDESPSLMAVVGMFFVGAAILFYYLKAGDSKKGDRIQESGVRSLKNKDQKTKKMEK